MFYFNSFCLLDRKTKTIALQAITISKQFGGLIFFDLNLPLPLWHSREETLSVFQEVLELADIIEVTKQELEFLCGIEPSERFDTKDNDRSKFVHYGTDIIAPLLHDNLEVLFVTNGTSKIHYYTKEHNGSVLGTEDVPITPFTSDMSAAGDGVVAGNHCLFGPSCVQFTRFFRFFLNHDLQVFNIIFMHFLKRMIYKFLIIFYFIFCTF